MQHCVRRRRYGGAGGQWKDGLNLQQIYEAGEPFERLLGAENWSPFLESRFHIARTVIILPRQARDKRRKRLSGKGVPAQTTRRTWEKCATSSVARALSITPRESFLSTKTSHPSAVHTFYLVCNAQFCRAELTCTFRCVSAFKFIS